MNVANRITIKSKKMTNNVFNSTMYPDYLYNNSIDKDDERRNVL